MHRRRERVAEESRRREERKVCGIELVVIGCSAWEVAKGGGRQQGTVFRSARWDIVGVASV